MYGYLYKVLYNIAYKTRDFLLFLYGDIGALYQRIYGLSRFG
jgi:hypothetical protein